MSESKPITDKVTDRRTLADSRSYSLFGEQRPCPPLAPGLYVVATPIGHLDDVTLRALATLAASDLIACEDTRVTRKLLSRYGVARPLVSYHEHNASEMRPRLLDELRQARAVALVSDAGTPLISDPGYRLVRAAQDAGFAVTAIPGPSAVLAALAAAGLPTDRFFFEGFLPPRAAARRARIAELTAIPATLVLFETGPRIAESLADLAAGLGQREAAVCRELTKRHEEVRRGELTALARAQADGAETRGEFVIVVAPPPPGEAAQPLDAERLDAMLAGALATASLKDAVAAVAGATGAPRRLVYQRALAFAQAQAAGDDRDDDA